MLKRTITTWTMHDGDKSYACEVPCSVYKTLQDNGVIEDPYYRENEAISTPISERDFEFETTFTLSEAELVEESLQLVFEGIDTLAEVYLNDVKLGDCDNMHRTWKYEIKGIAAAQNHLVLKLASPTVYAAEHARVRDLPGVEHCLPGYQYIRKAHCMFGWDWGPHLPDLGIWRDVYVLAGTGGRIENVYYRQEHLADGSVKLICEAEALITDKSVVAELEIKAPCAAAEADADGIASKIGADCAVAKTQADGVTIMESENCADRHQSLYTIQLTAENSSFQPGEPVKLRGEVLIEKPQLWYVRGLGGQPLYTCTLSLKRTDAPITTGDTNVANEIIDTYTRRIGLRTLTISQEKDEWGKEFCFINNGLKVFAMGANYIPEDQIVANRSKERTEQLLEDCLKANYNFIRVWGGGFYPDDWFFDWCDEHGIMIWEDFMFACASYLLTPEFEATVRAELKDNIIRMRNHASLAMYCGNNEIESAYAGWGWDIDERLHDDYLKLFEDIMPKMVEELDPQTFYWPSSPSSGGGFDNASSNEAGDMHYWAIWHNFEPIEAFRKLYYRFCSEYGFESLPDYKTCLAFADPEQGDMDLCGHVMQAHQKCTLGNEKLMFYLAQMVNYPYDFKRMIYCSQLVQADCIRSSVEHMRRARGRCMGSAYWQVNDSNPVISWSSIDYFGRWKALHYAAAKFYAPVLLSCDDTDPVHPVFYVSNDTRDELHLKIRVNLRDSKANVLKSFEGEYCAEPLSAGAALTISLEGFLDTTAQKRSRYLEYELLNAEEVQLTDGTTLAGTTVLAAGTSLGAGTTLFVRPKEFDFEQASVQIEVTDLGDSFAVSLWSDVYTKSVKLDLRDYDVHFSDNFFDVHGDETVTVTFEKTPELAGLSPEEILGQIEYENY